MNCEPLLQHLDIDEVDETQQPTEINTFGGGTVYVNHISSITRQIHNSSTNYAKELIKLLKHAASLLVWIFLN